MQGWCNALQSDSLKECSQVTHAGIFYIFFLHTWQYRHGRTNGTNSFCNLKGQMEQTVFVINSYTFKRKFMLGLKQRELISTTKINNAHLISHMHVTKQTTE